MSYRSLHSANERFELTVMFVLLGAFIVALTLMFVHPTGSLAVFFLGLLFLAVVAIAERFVHKAERQAARLELEQHMCPDCGAEINRDPKSGQWHCQKCDCTFTDIGERALE